MNIDHLMAQKPRIENVDADLNVLLTLNAETDMQSTGDIFDCNNIIIGKNTNVCYRREQFIGSDNDLPREFIVRDRRFTKDEICLMLTQNGLNILDVRYVRAGSWDKVFDKSQCKEILIVCQKGAKEITPTLI